MSSPAAFTAGLPRPLRLSARITFRRNHREIRMQLRGWAIQAVVGTLLATSMEAQAVDWPTYGRDLQGTRYLAADEITRENVKQLVVAWTYRTGETERRFATAKPTSF